MQGNNHNRGAGYLLAAALLLVPAQASAGWMDQIGGMLNDSGIATQAARSLPGAAGLSNADVIAGLRDALRIGSERVVGRLGRTDGFNADAKVHIPLPENLRTVKSALAAVGMGGLMDDLELRLNRAAEAATPKAKRLFVDAIRTMSFDDARKILNGPDDAATRYFRRRMSAPLAGEMRPIVRRALEQAGAVQAYERVIGQYRSLPFMPDVKADLTRHVIDLGLAGIFRYMAEEEAAIRHNPVKRSTAILKKVFAR